MINSFIVYIINTLCYRYGYYIIPIQNPECDTAKHDIPDSKVHGVNMGPTRVLSVPDGPHVGPMHLAIRDGTSWRESVHLYRLGKIIADKTRRYIYHALLIISAYTKQLTIKYVDVYVEVYRWSNAYLIDMMFSDIHE